MCTGWRCRNSEDGLRRALGEAHRRYTRLINFREGWWGHLWQGRFSSFVLEFNPVRARFVEKPELYPWSSAAAHVKGVDDTLVKVAALLGLVNDWRSLLQSGYPFTGVEKRHEKQDLIW